jgi:hypothetical protein
LALLLGAVARRVAPAIIRREVFETFDLSREKAAAKRRMSNKADPQFAARG